MPNGTTLLSHSRLAMLKRFLHIIIALSTLSWGWSACSKLEEEDTNEPPSNNEDFQGTIEAGDTLTVAQALTVEVGTDVIVKAYIVGYVDGTTMSKAAFTLPTSKANTNLIIADSPHENDYHNCLPIQVKSGTDEQITLNLLTNPYLLGSPVLVWGTLTTYFKVNGFKHPNYWIMELTEEDFTDTPKEGEPSPEPQPEPQPQSDTPTLNHTPQASIYGR